MLGSNSSANANSFQSRMSNGYATRFGLSSDNFGLSSVGRKGISNEQMKRLGLGVMALGFHLWLLGQNDLLTCCALPQTREILMEESNVQPVRCPVTVCGDIHGQFVSLPQCSPIQALAHTFTYPRSTISQNSSGSVATRPTPTTSSWGTMSTEDTTRLKP
jgi:hypothetical protein